MTLGTLESAGVPSRAAVTLMMLAVQHGKAAYADREGSLLVGWLYGTYAIWEEKR
jgi:hypothetical protein